MRRNLDVETLQRAALWHQRVTNWSMVMPGCRPLSQDEQQTPLERSASPDVPGWLPTRRQSRRMVTLRW